MTGEIEMVKAEPLEMSNGKQPWKDTVHWAEADALPTAKSLHIMDSERRTASGGM
jgi:hypothetical protein